MDKKIEIKDLKERIEAKLITRGIPDPGQAENDHIYQATVTVLKDIMLEYRAQFKKRKKENNSKKICYLCMEFLVGRSLKSVSENLGVYDAICEIFEE